MAIPTPLEETMDKAREMLKMRQDAVEQALKPKPVAPKAPSLSRKSPLMELMEQIHGRS